MREGHDMQHRSGGLYSSAIQWNNLPSSLKLIISHIQTGFVKMDSQSFVV